jgi:AcrR family transcriptional regulator
VPAERRTQAQRRQATRQALMEAALLRIQAGESFDTLSLRSVARDAGVVPTAFYRHFATLEELGLALVDDSFRSLRAMLRGARESGGPDDAVVASVENLTAHVQHNRDYWSFIVRSQGTTQLRHAIRTEIRLVASELATDLARFPVLREWTTDDLQMVSALIVNSMISTVEELLEVAPGDERREAEIAAVAKKQLRLVVLGMPAWRSGS